MSIAADQEAPPSRGRHASWLKGGDPVAVARSDAACLRAGGVPTAGRTNAQTWYPR